MLARALSGPPTLKTVVARAKERKLFAQHPSCREEMAMILPQLEQAMLAQSRDAVAEKKEDEQGKVQKQDKGLSHAAKTIAEARERAQSDASAAALTKGSDEPKPTRPTTHRRQLTRTPTNTLRAALLRHVVRPAGRAANAAHAAAVDATSSSSSSGRKRSKDGATPHELYVAHVQSMKLSRQQPGKQLTALCDLVGLEHDRQGPSARALAAAADGKAGGKWLGSLASSILGADASNTTAGGKRSSAGRGGAAVTASAQRKVRSRRAAEVAAEAEAEARAHAEALVAEWETLEEEMCLRGVGEGVLLEGGTPIDGELERARWIAECALRAEAWERATRRSETLDRIRGRGAAEREESSSDRRQRISRGWRRARL